jgi:hypothetical protein
MSLSMKRKQNSNKACLTVNVRTTKHIFTTVAEILDLCCEKIAAYFVYMGTAVAEWLRYCATNRKVAGSIPDCVIGIFH